MTRDIGVPKEAHGHEHRVGLTPFAVSRLTRQGCRVYVEHGAGDDSHFGDEVYREAGAEIVFDTDEVYQRSDLICRVGALRMEDAERIRPGGTVCGFHHFAVTPRDIHTKLAENEVTMVGYEIIEDLEGGRPLLRAFSELAGRISVHKAAELLSFDSGGRGLVLGGSPGIPPATVVILGAGTLGRTAASIAAACGAHVIILDTDLDKLRGAMEFAGQPVVTAIASHRNLGRFTAFADVLIGAVLIPGGRAPFLVMESMVKAMKPGSVILDLSIDQGGCVETSRPTTPDNPVYEVHGVNHYCVPNMTANVPRTASRALSIVALPFLLRLALEGTDAALRTDAGLARGTYLFRGKVVNRTTAEALGAEYTPLSEMLG